MRRYAHLSGPGYAEGGWVRHPALQQDIVEVAGLAEVGDVGGLLGLYALRQPGVVLLQRLQEH